jgi:hypothetical protein
MPGVSRRAYARLHGVSEGAVRKAIAAGKIPVMPDGLIDPAVADTAWLRNRDTGQQSKMAEAISAAPAQMALGPPAIVRASHEAAASAMPPEDSQPGESIVTPAPLTAARIENTQESTAFKRMLRMKAAGDLIEPSRSGPTSTGSSARRPAPRSGSGRATRTRSSRWTRPPTPSVHRVVLVSATQMIKTSVIENATARAIDVDPGPILIVQPRKEDAVDFVEERIEPMIRDTPQLRAKVYKASKKLKKLFRGGILAITSAGAPENAGRRAVMLLCLDEVDRYRLTREGNFLPLVRKRLATYKSRGKEICASSPTFEGSEIDKAYQASDQREFTCRARSARKSRA